MSPERQQWLAGKSKPKKGPTEANSLTAAIIKHIRASGGYATRINTQGQFRDGRWTKGTTAKGTADVHACFQGRHLSIEVKVGRDVISDAQRLTAEEITRAGGVYFVARDLNSFLTWFEDLKNGKGADV